MYCLLTVFVQKGQISARRKGLLKRKWSVGRMKPEIENVWIYEKKNTSIVWLTQETKWSCQLGALTYPYLIPTTGSLWSPPWSFVLRWISPWLSYWASNKNSFWTENSYVKILIIGLVECIRRMLWTGISNLLFKDRMRRLLSSLEGRQGNELNEVDYPWGEHALTYDAVSIDCDEDICS